MGENISKLIRMITSNKKKVAFSLFCFLFFLVVLFPFDDLADFITEKIAKESQNQVFVTFKKLGISLLPVGLSFEDVTVDTPVVPTLKAERLALAPSIASFLAFKPGFVASAKGLFDGDVNLTYKTGKEISAEPKMNAQIIEIDMSDANLKKISQFADLPVALEGLASADLDGEIDPNFKIPPKSEFNVVLKNLKIPDSTVPTMLGPLNLPNISFSAVNLKGRMVNGELFIEDSQIGQAGDSVYGRMKGKFTVNVVKLGARIVPRFGAYEIKLDLNINNQAEKDFGLFLGFIEKYKTRTGTGARYALQLSGANFNSPPKDSNLTQF